MFLIHHELQRGQEENREGQIELLVVTDEAGYDLDYNLDRKWPRIYSANVHSACNVSEPMDEQFFDHISVRRGESEDMLHIVHWWHLQKVGGTNFERYEKAVEVNHGAHSAVVYPSIEVNRDGNEWTLKVRSGVFPVVLALPDETIKTAIVEVLRFYEHRLTQFITSKDVEEGNSIWNFIE